MSLFWIVATACCLVVGLGTWSWARRHGRWVGIASGVWATALAAVVFPIPIHGGVTNLAVVAFEEWRGRAESRRDLPPVSIARRAKVSDRFARRVEVEAISTVGSWSRVRAGRYDDAWWDRETGLVWRGPLVASPTGPVALDVARALCDALEPRGAWLLASEVELYYLWRSRGHRHMPGDGRSGVSFAVPSNGLELATRFAGRDGVSVRCVALAATPPPGGHPSVDVPTADHNAFQLSKHELFRSDQ